MGKIVGDNIKNPDDNPICPYCDKKSEFVDSSIIYGTSYGMIYHCTPCKSFVGVHKGTNVPLGTLANNKLREWRKKAHFWFDQLLKEKYIDQIYFEDFQGNLRSKSYKWLSLQMNLDIDQTHIAMFNAEQCSRVVNIVRERIDKIKNSNSENTNFI